MSVPDPPLSHEVLERTRAYVRVDQRVVAALPELGEAIRSFRPVPGPAGESVAEWLAERALREPQFARAADTPGIGDEMLRHTDTSARRALRYVGATVLVVDPFDQDTAEMWRQRFGFQDSEQAVPGNRQLHRQWLSLQQ
jgi:hypothetical protein